MFWTNASGRTVDEDIESLRSAVTFGLSRNRAVGGGHVRRVSGKGSNFAHTPCRDDAEQLVDAAGFQEVRLTPPGRFHPARLAQAELAPGERRAFAFLAFFVDPFGRPLCPRHDVESAHKMRAATNQ